MLQAEKINVEVAAAAVDEYADATPPTGCQSQVASQAPSSYPLYHRGASLLHEGRMWSSGAKCADSEKLRIITTTRRKSGLAST